MEWAMALQMRQTPENLALVPLFSGDKTHLADLADLDAATVVAALATAADECGSIAEVLRNMALHRAESGIAERGIHDRYLWDMQERVARWIVRGRPNRSCVHTSQP
jgi:cation transport regulator ChaC